MSKTVEQLRSIKVGKSSRIRGQDVKRNGDLYLVDGDELTLDEAAKRLEQTGQPRTGLDYAWTAFLECPQYSRNPIKQYQCGTRAEHQELVEAVKKRGNYLYYGAAVKVDNKFQVNSSLLILDWDTVPEHPDEIKRQAEDKVRAKDPKKWDGGLSCPFCRVEVSSTPGRTLHVKAAHPERLDEYYDLLNGKSGSAPVSVPEEEDEDDVVNRQSESDDVGSLKCPFCQVKINSTSGRTLHVQGKHPERLQEYQKLLIGGGL